MARKSRKQKEAEKVIQQMIIVEHIIKNAAFYSTLIQSLGDAAETALALLAIKAEKIPPTHKD